MKKKFLVFAIVVLLMSFATTAMAGDPDPGTATVGISVMNVDDSNSATVGIDFINTSGGVDLNVPKTIASNGAYHTLVSSLSLPGGWQGSAIASSTTEIVAIAQVRWEGGQYSDGRTAGAYNSFDGTATTLYFPSLKARTAGQNSLLTIQSAEAASTTSSTSYNIVFYNRDGSTAATLNGESVNKGAAKTYDLLDDLNLPAKWNGSATVTSSSPLAGAVSTHWPGYSTVYSGMTQGGTTAYIPEARRRLSSSGVWEQYAGIVVQNLDINAANNITVEWYDRAGNLLYDFDTTIPANSSLGFNTRYTSSSNIPAGDQAGLESALGTSWNGSVIIRSTSSLPLAAVNNLQWTDSSNVGEAAVSFTSFDTGTDKVVFPATYRKTDWTKFSGVIVQNVGSAACNGFTVTWYDVNGSEVLSFTDSLNPGIAHGFNTRYGVDIPGDQEAALGSNWLGSVVIEGAASCELAGVHNTLWPAVTDSTSYQGFNK